MRVLSTETDVIHAPGLEQNLEIPNVPLISDGDLLLLKADVLARNAHGRG